jgi:hypothetical protein
MALHKRQAQDTLKYYRRNGTLFTLELRRPQEYFASTIKSEVMESLSSNKITPIDPTGVSNYLHHLSNRHEDIVIQSLEGYVLPLLRTTPPYIHNLHFKPKIGPNCYAEYDIQKYSV